MFLPVLYTDVDRQQQAQQHWITQQNQPKPNFYFIYKKTGLMYKAFGFTLV